jgi:flagellar motor protein MotB
MTTSSRLNAPPDWSEPLVAPLADGDDVGWLITFSDLVLQLFAFVIVAAVCGAAASHAGARSQPTSTAAAPASVEAAPVTTVATRRSDAEVGVAAPSAFAPTDAWAGDDRDGRATAHRTAGSATVEEERIAAGGDEPRSIAAAEEPRRDDRERDLDDGPQPSASLDDPTARSGDDQPSEIAAERPSAPSTPPARVLTLARYLSAFVAARGDVDAATVTAGGSDVRLAFGGRLGFRPGSAELLPRGRSFIGEVQRIASAVPDLAIEVAGYTDDVPIHTREFPSNLELSLARAARVARELQRADPALAVRTVALGFGEHHAIAPNDDAANRARNRRVEVRLVARDHSMP